MKQKQHKTKRKTETKCFVLSLFWLFGFLVSFRCGSFFLLTKILDSLCLFSFLFPFFQEANLSHVPSPPPPEKASFADMFISFFSQWFFLLLLLLLLWLVVVSFVFVFVGLLFFSLVVVSILLLCCCFFSLLSLFYSCWLLLVIAFWFSCVRSFCLFFHCSSCFFFFLHVLSVSHVALALGDLFCLVSLLWLFLSSCCGLFLFFMLLSCVKLFLFFCFSCLLLSVAVFFLLCFLLVFGFFVLFFWLSFSLTTWGGRRFGFHFQSFPNLRVGIFAVFVCTFLGMGPVFLMKHYKNRGFSVFGHPKIELLGPRSRAKMLAKVEIKRWPFFVHSWALYLASILTSKFAVFSREKKIFIKKHGLNLASILTLQHIYIYIWEHIYIYVHAVICTHYSTYAVELMSGPLFWPFLS